MWPLIRVLESTTKPVSGTPLNLTLVTLLKLPPLISISSPALPEPGVAGQDPRQHLEAGAAEVALPSGVVIVIGPVVCRGWDERP